MGPRGPPPPFLREEKAPPPPPPPPKVPRPRYRGDLPAAAAARPRHDDTAERTRCAPRARRGARRRAAATGRERGRLPCEGRGPAACRARLPRFTRDIADRGVFPRRRLGLRRSRNP